MKVPNGSLYEKLCAKYGSKTKEVILSNRRVATVIGGGEVFEILEPKSDEIIKDVFIDHAAYRTNSFDKARGSFDKVLTEFDFGQTKGFKIESSGIIIEIRNDRLIDSKID